jgi:hypothetical protein
VGKLETPNDRRRPPVHKKMGLNLSKNEVRVLSISFINFISPKKKKKNLRSFGNWTGILKKFRLNFMASKTNIETDESASNHPTQQLRALFRLHSNMNVDKSLINLQLAATHISFMLQLHTNRKVRPKHFFLFFF